MDIEDRLKWNRLLENSLSAQVTIDTISLAGKFDCWIPSTDALKRTIKNLSSAKNLDAFGSPCSIKELIQLGADPRKMGALSSHQDAFQICLKNELSDKLHVLLDCGFFTEEEIAKSIQYHKEGACKSLVSSWLLKKNIEKMIDNGSNYSKCFDFKS